MKHLMILAVALFGSHAFADLQSCKQAMRESVENCKQTGESTYAADEASSQQMIAQAGINMRGGAEAMNQAASANVQRWGAVKNFCEAERRKCSDKCNAVNESPQARQQARDEKENCFAKVNQVIAQADRGISSNTGYTAQSANSGNNSGMQGAETIEGNVHQAGSGPQGLAWTQNGEVRTYDSSNTPGTDNLKANMQTLKSWSDNNDVRILMPPPKIK